MESVYAALILHSAQKKINEASIEKILEAAGVKSDKNQLKALVAGLEGKNIDEIIASASAAPVSVSAAHVVTPAGKEDKPKEDKKKEKKEEKKEVEEPTGIGALFG